MLCHFRKTLLVIVGLLGCGSPFLAPGRAQVSLTSGSILGSVKDTSGAVLPDAEITVRHQETGLVRRARTNDSGNYSMAITATACSVRPFFPAGTGVGRRASRDCPITRAISSFPGSALLAGPAEPI